MSKGQCQLIELEKPRTIVNDCSRKRYTETKTDFREKF